MSKLGSQIRHGDRATERLAPRLKMRYVSVRETVEDTVPFGLAQRYQIGAKLECSAVISETMSAHSRVQIMEAAVKRCRQAILEEVFGEYRRPLLTALQQLHNDEVDEATSIISAVLTNMFDAEPMEQP